MAWSVSFSFEISGVEHLDTERMMAPLRNEGVEPWKISKMR
jgi:hypothetical protein